jgi:hypothetical protein
MRLEASLADEGVRLLADFTAYDGIADGLLECVRA